MKKLAITCFGAMFSVTAFGQDLLQCLDPDVVNGLVFGGRSERKLEVTPTLPEALAALQTPAGFTLLGTAKRNGTPSGTVAYRTTLDSGAAHAALMASLEAAGWQREDDEITGIRPALFNLADGQAGRSTFCRDGDRLYVRVADVDGTRYPTINVTDSGERRVACNTMDPELAAMRGRTNFLTNGTPSLRLPPGTRSASPDGTLESGGGSAGPYFSTGVQIHSPASPTALLDHLGSQMAEEGWRVEARWSGSVSNGARWTRTADSGTPYWATIEIVELTADTYDVSYRQMYPR